MEHSFKLHRSIWEDLDTKTDPLPRTAVLTELVRRVVAGDLEAPGDPENFIPAASAPVSTKIGIHPDVWLDPRTGKVPEQYDTGTKQNQLLQKLSYALVEGRIIGGLRFENADNDGGKNDG